MAKARTPRRLTHAELRTRTLEALGSYQKQGADLDDLDAISDMLRNESDRGLVIILVSIIEDALLERILTKFGTLTPAQRKELTRSGAPLSSMSAIINIAHALDLVSQDSVEHLVVMKAMRNACAHSRHDISFATPALREAIVLCVDADENTKADLLREERRVVRDMFVAIATLILEVLMSEVPHGTPHEPKLSPELLRKMKAAWTTSL